MRPKRVQHLILLPLDLHMSREKLKPISMHAWLPQLLLYTTKRPIWLTLSVSETR